MERVLEFSKEAGVYYLATAEGGNTQVFYFKNATATISSFIHGPEVISF